MWCGECPPCRAGRTNLCRSYYTLGLQADGGLGPLPWWNFVDWARACGFDEEARARNHEIVDGAAADRLRFGKLLD